MKPLISVVIPVYNICNYVGKCLESVCGQSYENIEIIVVDDGSTDGSSKICDEFTKNDKRVKVFHRKNGGLSAARNFGISKAHGDFVALVDGDDWVQRNYAAEMVKALDEKTDIVVCGYNNVVPKQEETSGKEAAVKLLIGQENLDIVAWNKLYRRSLFDDIKYPDGEKHEDSLTTYKLLALARVVKYVPESLYMYETREGSIMNQTEILSRLKVRKKAAEEAVNYFSGDDDLEQAAKIAVLTAKYAFVDAVVRGEIDKKYYAKNREWVLVHQGEYLRNKYLTRKLKIYNLMIGGVFYKIFRKIRHE